MNPKERDHQKDPALRRSVEVRVLIGSTLVAAGLLLVAVGQFIPLGPFAAKDVLPCRGPGIESRENAIESIGIETKPAAGRNTSAAEGESADLAEARAFRPYGNAAYLFVQMGAYRGGADTFAVVGLASKPLHVFGKPRFECEWIPGGGSNSRPVAGKAYKMLPDWGYGRVYTVVVVNCTFSESVGADGSGGELVLRALPGDGFGEPARIVALTEPARFFNRTGYRDYPYDYLYCGSSLFGDLSPQRMREWMAYHASFFGDRSHFVFHDAGGAHAEVRRVLEPWIRAGRVTLQDITAQERFDGYYHNQFLVVNDCLHRFRFTARWTFFFDVDEYLYLPPGNTLAAVLRDFANYSQFTIEQYRMSNELCLSANHSADYSKQWGFEKLVFRDVKRGVRRDRKYAVQARNVFATGVHMSENLVGRTLHKTENRIRYYHYHNSISARGEPCREFVNSTSRGRSGRADLTWLKGTPYVYDPSMRRLAPYVKRFERQKIGSVLASTAQK